MCGIEKSIDLILRLNFQHFTVNILKHFVLHLFLTKNPKKTQRPLMEWVTMGFINIPKRFLKIHKTSSAFNLHAVPLYMIAYYSYVNMSMRNMRQSHKDWRTMQEERNYSRKKRPPEELAQTRSEDTLHGGYVFQMQWRRKPLGLISFFMRPWDSSRARASLYSLSAQAQNPSLRNLHYLRITVIQILLSCLGLWVSQNICVPSRLLGQQGLIVPHYCFNNFPSVRSDLSSE